MYFFKTYVKTNITNFAVLSVNDVPAAFDVPVPHTFSPFIFSSYLGRIICDMGRRKCIYTNNRLTEKHTQFSYVHVTVR